jgi:hypothetical protein
MSQINTWNMFQDVLLIVTPLIVQTTGGLSICALTILFAAPSVNHRLPSGSAVIPSGSLFAVGTENSMLGSRL